MRSVRLTGQAAVACIETPTPEPGEGEVLIATQVSALCGSELKAYRGEGMETGNTGHEAAGIVAGLGPGVKGLQEGQRVGVSAISGCGDCGYCALGQYTYCSGYSYRGSMHAEYFVAAANACHLLPDDLSWEVGLLISGDGFGVPYHTSTKLHNEPVEDIAIFGLGPIGLGNTLMQTYLGRRVVGVDVVPYRLEMGSRLGAAHIVDASGGVDVVEAIRHLTGGRGADVCIEAAGRPQSAKQCFAAARTAGTVVFNGEQPALELSPSADFIRRDITALGSWYYHFSQFAAMLELYRKGLAVDRLITHRFPMSQADEAFKLMAAGQTGKVMLEIGATP
jgi:threonine dehydrogenase-like Zn-dependent dehydrogenase